MTQTKNRAGHLKRRVFKSAATSALALSALAGGVILSDGEAKAFGCTFDYTNNLPFPVGDPNPISILPPCQYGVYYDTNPIPTDKQIKFVKGPTSGTGDIEWKWIDKNGNGTWGAHPDLHVDEWHVDFDFNPDFNTVDPLNPFKPLGPNVSIFEYIVKIIPSPAPNDKAKVFQDVSLSAMFGPADGGASSVQKDIYTVINHAKGDFLGSIICLAPAAGGYSCGPNVELAPIYDKLYIVDTATYGGRTIDAYQNVFRQVPGPLPILGAGLALGSVRKLRNLTSRLKSYSMG
ncbi:MAG: hypothetical protein ACK5Q7_05055 [Cyanobacteriota bacterium]